MEILSEHKLDFKKPRNKDTALTCFCNYNVNIPKYLSNEGFETLETLSTNCTLVIQKTDKDNSVFIDEKGSCFRQMETIISDLNKFEKVIIKIEISNF